MNYGHSCKTDPGWVLNADFENIVLHRFSRNQDYEMHHYRLPRQTWDFVSFRILTLLCHFDEYTSDPMMGGVQY